MKPFGEKVNMHSSVIITNGERVIQGGDITTEKQPIVPQVPKAVQQPLPNLDMIFNKLSVKFNAKTMLEQEAGEALSVYINAVNQTIGALHAKVKELEETIKAKESKA